MNYNLGFCKCSLKFKGGAFSLLIPFHSFSYRVSSAVRVYVRVLW